MSWSIIYYTFLSVCSLLNIDDGRMWKFFTELFYVDESSIFNSSDVGYAVMHRLMPKSARARRSSGFSLTLATNCSDSPTVNPILSSVERLGSLKILE